MDLLGSSPLLCPFAYNMYEDMRYVSAIQAVVSRRPGQLTQPSFSRYKMESCVFGKGAIFEG
jgi:hypothetical protein